MHFQQLHRLYLLEYVFASRLVAASVLKCVNKTPFDFRLNAKVNCELEVSKLIRIESVHTVVHLILLHLWEYETLVTESAIFILLSQVLVQELK